MRALAQQVLQKVKSFSRARELRFGFVAALAWMVILSTLRVEAATPLCGENEKTNPIYTAFQSCQAARAANGLDSAFEQMSKITGAGFCSGAELSRKPQDTLKALCQDPAGYVCSKNEGKVFGSRCQLQMFDPSDAKHLPEYVAENCLADFKIKSFFAGKIKECPFGLPGPQCDLFLKAKYPKVVRAFIVKEAYTPERVARVRAAFLRIQKKEVEIIQASKLIPSDRKRMLIEILSATRITLPNEFDNSDSCAVPGPDGPETAVYFEPHKNVIHFCIGAISQLDQMSDYDLFHTLGHELSHSIDPCSIENQKQGLFGAQTYPKLLTCLHGGGGADGCSGAVISCNTARGIEEGCGKGPRAAACKKEIARKPSCPFGPDDPTYDFNSLAGYRKGKDPVNQIQESFADFVGAEVVGRLAQEDANQGKLLVGDKLNGMLTIASDYVRLHGVCLKTNTHDPHPVGTLRVNRVIMGVKEYREAFCGAGAPPPATQGAGVTCPSL